MLTPPVAPVTPEVPAPGSSLTKNPVAQSASARWAALLLWFVLAGGCGLTWFSLQPPAPVPATAPPGAFSAARATVHLRAIAQTPHPFGSPANHAVKDYILAQLNALGLETQTQAFRNGEMGTNVMAWIPGTHDPQLSSRGNAVALVCHYDSAVRAPGASDDGVAVAALLETARALKAGSRLKNDLILLFTDGEERGLLGARAFVTECPWNERIALVLNFEARGINGPVFMFETAPGNGRVITEFGRGAVHPVANSLMYEVYRKMPNDTDFTAFKRAGIPGLNFAFIGEAQHYHAPTDDLAHFSPRCLQQDGLYALSLARHFGNLDLARLESGDAVYFDVLGLWLARYPEKLALPLALLTAVLFVVVTVREWKCGRVSLWKLLLGCLMAGVYVVLIGVVYRYGLKLTGAERSTSARVWQFLHWPYWTMAVGLTVSLGATLHLLLRRWLAPANLALGAWFWWLVLAVVSAVYVPGASYLALWPLLFGLLGQLGSPRDETFSWSGVVWLGGMALPLLILVSPLIWEFHLALGPRAMFVPMAVLALAVGALSLQVEAAYQAWKWALPLGGLMVAVGAVLKAF